MLRRLALLALLTTALAGCASEGPRGGGRHGPRGEGFRAGPPARPKLFISPSGEPFRGDNGLAAWFAKADTDHDGALSEAEFAADAQRFFKTLDRNGDGKLDGFEIQAYEHDIVPEIGTIDLLEPMAEGAPRRQGDGKGGGGMGGGRRGGGMGGGRRGGGQGQTAQAPTASTVRSRARRASACSTSRSRWPTPTRTSTARSAPRSGRRRPPGASRAWTTSTPAS